MWPFKKKPNNDRYRIINSCAAVERRIITDVLVCNPSTGLTMRVKCLWDTGVRCSSLSSTLIRQLDLLPHPDKIIAVSTTNGIKESLVYDALFCFGDEQIPVSTFEINNPISVIDVIIGMDVISRGDMNITNAGGKCEMIFRIPPQGHINA